MDRAPQEFVQALRHSHDRLAAQVTGLSHEQLAAPSYCRGWDISQVLSHLGSGAEINLTNLERALGDEEPLEREDYPLVWSRWNALSPQEKASQLRVWDRRHVSVLEGLDAGTLSGLQVSAAGHEVELWTALASRLSEHAVHSWDVAVALDPAAEIAAEAAGLMLEDFPSMVPKVAKAEGARWEGRVDVRTDAPARRFLLDLGDKVELREAEPGPAPDAGTLLELPASAFVRLVFGRLDDDHVPAGLRIEGDISLDRLRGVFAGV